ncbi:MAG TPA: hypothetical protein VK672_01705 [Solirubrobacteraceae bacterium]|jgi:hypothetical protein|nr:hypothetical protein [Solirubrobacteraceae bacterium]
MSGTQMGRRSRAALEATLLSLAAACATLALLATPVFAAQPGASKGKGATSPGTMLAAVASSGEGAGSLESAASKAGETGRKVAMSLIALGFAIASIVLAFRRDFKEAAGIFAVGLVAILLATPAGVNVLHDTVNSLFGAS